MSLKAQGLEEIIEQVSQVGRRKYLKNILPEIYENTSFPANVVLTLLKFIMKYKEIYENSALVGGAGVALYVKKNPKIMRAGSDLDLFFNGNVSEIKGITLVSLIDKIKQTYGFSHSYYVIESPYKVGKLSLNGSDVDVFGYDTGIGPIQIPRDVKFVTFSYDGLTFKTLPPEYLIATLINPKAITLNRIHKVIALLKQLEDEGMNIDQIVKESIEIIEKGKYINISEEETIKALNILIQGISRYGKRESYHLKRESCLTKIANLYETGFKTAIAKQTFLT